MWQVTMADGREYPAVVKGMDEVRREALTQP